MKHCAIQNHNVIITLFGFISAFSCHREATPQIAPKYEAVQPFHEGLAAVKLQNAWGFIDTSGNMVIEPKYAEVSPFQNGRTTVTTTDQKKLILNTKGEILETVNFLESGTPIADLPGLLLFTENGFWGVKNKSGVAVIPSHYSELHYVGQGLFVGYYAPEVSHHLINAEGVVIYNNKGPIQSAIVNNKMVVENYDHLSGIINTSGEVVIPTEYLTLELQPGYIVYGKETGYLGTMDYMGRIIIPNTYNRFELFGVDRAILYNADTGRGQMLTETGNPVGDPMQMVSGTHFFDLLPVEGSNKKWGYINNRFEQKIPAVFDYAENFFPSGAAIILAGGRKGLIDTAGKIMIAPVYEEIIYNANYYTLYKDMRYEIADSNFRIVVSASKHPIEYIGNGVYFRYKISNSIDIARPSLWYNTKGEITLISEGNISGVYSLCNQLLADGSELEKGDIAVLVESEGMIAMKRNGKWGFFTCSPAVSHTRR